MSDREEIRWKLSNIQEVLAISRDEHEKEQENFQKAWKDLSEQLIRGRNTLVGGIGFGVLLIISLISIDSISNDYVWIIPVGIIVALVLYVIINIILKLQADKYYELDDEYQQQVLDLIEFESWYIGYSLRDEITADNIWFSLHFVVVV